MPRTNTAAGDLVIVEFPAMATTIEPSRCPGREVMAGHGRVRDLAMGS